MDLEHDDITDLQVSDFSKKIGGLALQLGYEGSLTVGALEDEIRFYQQRTVEACLELGKRLIILKEMTPHGEFKQRIEMLNIHERTARRFMTAALKFSKTDNLSVLKAAGNQSKLLELLVLDDGEIAELGEGGSVSGITLDSIDKMTASELRKALREAKADAEAKDSIIRKKDETINKLDTELSVLNSPMEIKLRQEAEHQSIEKAALQTLSAASLTFLNAVMRFQNEVNSVLDTAEQHHILDLNARAEEAVVATYQRIAQFSQKLGVVVDFDNMVSPEWLFPNADPIAELAELEQFMPAVETDMEQ